MTSTTLDIGCGRNKVPGALGLDWIGATAADVVCDLTQFPWPLPADAFTVVYANNVMEHLPNIPGTMQEIYRVARAGARVHIKTPHFASLTSWEDPTHVHHFAYESFDYFCETGRHVAHYATCRFRVVRKQLHFGGHPLSLLGRLVFGLSPRGYERHWAFLLRPSTLEVELEAVKD